MRGALATLPGSSMLAKDVIGPVPVDVFVRCRPPIDEDIDIAAATSNAGTVEAHVEDAAIVFSSPLTSSPSTTYGFDAVLDETATQGDVFDKACKEIVGCVELRFDPRWSHGS